MGVRAAIDSRLLLLTLGLGLGTRVQPVPFQCIASVVIPASTPQLLFYAKDPLRGLLLDTALPSGVSLAAKEFTIQAMPYYFATQSLANGAATYEWTLNGDETTGPNAAQGLLTLRQTGTGTGSAVIGAIMQNSDGNKLVQAAQNALQIVFGQSQSSGSSLFGL